MFKNKILLLALVVVLSLSLAVVGCAKKDEEEKGKAPAEEKEQVLNYNVGDDPETLDPAKATDNVAITVINTYMEGLIRYGADNKITKGLAEDWTISDDGKVYEFKIREDAKWSNGDPITAHDFEYAWKRVLNPDTAAIYAYQLYYIKNAQGYNMSQDETYEGPKYTADDVGVTAVDEKTLKVELEAAAPQFLGLTAFTTYMPVHKETVEANPDGWASKPETLIGAGPFNVKEISPDQHIIVEKNDNYWDKENVKLDKIKMTLVPSETTALQMFETGQVDIVENPPNDELPRLVDEGKAVIAPDLAVYYYSLNTTKAPFNDVKVRKALTYAIDRKKIVEYITQGGQVPAMAFVPYGLPDVDLKEDYREKAGQYFEDNNLEKAKELLAEAGYPNGEGFPEFTILTNDNEGHLKVAQAIQEMWKKNLNIDTEIRSQEWKVFLKTRRSLDYDVARDGWGADYLDAMTFMDLLMSPGISGNNNTGWGNEQFDELLEKAKSTGEQEVRMEAMHQAEKILMDEMPVIPIYFYTNPYMDSGKLKGHIKPTFGPEFEFKWAYFAE